MQKYDGPWRTEDTVVIAICLVLTWGLAFGPLPQWIAYAIGWTMCLVGAPGIDCSYY